MKANKKRIKMGVMLGCSAAILMGFSSSVLAKHQYHPHHHGKGHEAVAKPLASEDVSLENDKHDSNS